MTPDACEIAHFSSSASSASNLTFTRSNQCRESNREPCSKIAKMYATPTMQYERTANRGFATHRQQIHRLHSRLPVVDFA